MRKLLITIATAASALAVAAPASAQYFPQPRGNAYGYNNYGQVRSLQVRVDRLQQRIQRLDSRDRISEREARNLREDARDLERRLHRASRNGLHPQEAQQIEYRLARIEQRLMRDANDGRGGWGNQAYGQGYGQGAYAIDRDRDGRDDRYEDDRGTRTDRRW